MYVCMYVCIFMYVCTCMYVCTYVCTYTYIHTYTHRLTCYSCNSFTSNAARAHKPSSRGGTQLCGGGAPASCTRSRTRRNRATASISRDAYANVISTADAATTDRQTDRHTHTHTSEGASRRHRRRVGGEGGWWWWWGGGQLGMGEARVACDEVWHNLVPILLQAGE